MHTFSLKFPSPFLLGDIGGTNARFAIINTREQNMQSFPTLKVAQFQTIHEAIDHHILPFITQKPKTLILALAGPIEGSSIALTNAHWVIDAQALLHHFAFDNVLLINDFEAQALATTVLDKKFLKKIGGHCQKEYSTRVILGPGTGLGVAGLACTNQRYLPIPGEGGHVDFAARTHRDRVLFPYFLRNQTRVSAEDLLSGRGLECLYRAICLADNKQIELEKADAITKAISYNPQAREAIELFLKYLARIAGDFALIFKAHGGVYIGGGIIPNLMEVIDEPTFRKEFEDKNPHQNLLASIPIFIITHPNSALEGIAALAQTPECFLINYHGRLWNIQ